MMFTDLAYQEIGGIVATFLLFFSICVVIFRFFTAFHNYIQTGKFGDFKKSLMGYLIEYPQIPFKYAFIGYHPGILIADALILFLIAVLAIPFWGAYIVIGLVLLLGRIMRKRIAIKQEFINKLEGTHDNE